MRFNESVQPRQVLLRTVRYTDDVLPSSNDDRKRIHFTVTDVRDMEFIQNKLERRLNIGRILFRGNAEMDPVYPLKESQSTIFLLCGIPHFAEFQAKMEQGDKQ